MTSRFLFGEYTVDKEISVMTCVYGLTIVPPKTMNMCQFPPFKFVTFDQISCYNFLTID